MISSILTMGWCEMWQGIEDKAWVSLNNPTCPKCDYQIDYSNYDGYLLGDNRLECPKCGQMLDICGEVEYSFTTTVVEEV